MGRSHKSLNNVQILITFIIITELTYVSFVLRPLLLAIRMKDVINLVT